MKPWECPRCKKINAPWINQCFCGPTIVPETIAGDEVPARVRAALLPARPKTVPMVTKLLSAPPPPPPAPVLLTMRKRPLSPTRPPKSFDFDTDEDQETEVLPKSESLRSFLLRMDDD